MNEMIFKSEEFGKVRTYGVNGETWFVGQDVAHALGYRNTRTALAAHVEKEDKTTVLIQVDGTAYKTHAVVISESGLYALVMGSKLATARRLKHWITAEVLPAVRKEGGYLVTRPGDTDEDILARGILVMQATLQRQNEQIAALQPKADYTDEVLCSVSCLTTTQIAKELDMTGRELNLLLCSLGIQYRQSGTVPALCRLCPTGIRQEPHLEHPIPQRKGEDHPPVGVDRERTPLHPPAAGCRALKKNNVTVKPK